MSYKRVYPETGLKSVDVLSVKNYFNAGCIVSDGKLKPALNRSVRTSGVLSNIIRTWYSAHTKDYIYCTAEGYVYYTTTIMGASKGMKVASLNHSLLEINEGTPYAVIVGTIVYIAVNGMTNTLKPFKGAVNSCVLKNGRIFGIDNTDPYKIKWSGEGGLDDWTDGISGAGWTVVQNGTGEIINLIVYKDKIVAVREYGLTFLSAYGTPENYKLSYLERSLPKIYKNTAAVAGDSLMFYTEDGLYVYDGNKVEKYDKPLSDEIVTPNTVFCGKGKYYVCGESRTLQRNAVLAVDVIHGLSYVIDEEAEAVCEGEEFYRYNKTFEYRMDDGGEYSFISGEIDFSAKGKKVLKEVVIDGGNEVSVEVSNGVISRIVGGVRGKFRPNMRGKSFKITVRGSGIINNITAVAEVENDV